jgi:hypothetical protein
VRKENMNYTIQDVKDEVYYYTGKKNVSDAEAKEILWFVETNKAPLGEVIEAYYSCDY